MTVAWELTRNGPETVATQSTPLLHALSLKVNKVWEPTLSLKGNKKGFSIWKMGLPPMYRGVGARKTILVHARASALITCTPHVYKGLPDEKAALVVTSEWTLGYGRPAGQGGRQDIYIYM